MPDPERCLDCAVLNNPILQAVPQEARDRAVCLFRQRLLPAGALAALAGTPAHSVFGVARGQVKVTISRADGREQIVGLYGPGTLVGLDCLELDEYPFDIVAATDVAICHAPARAFAEAVTASPEFARAVLAHLSQELRRARTTVYSLGAQDARGRVARLLAEAADTDAQVTLPLNRKDTAAMLGMAEESLSRQLARLESQGVVSRAGRRLHILDPERLDELATG